RLVLRQDHDACRAGTRQPAAGEPALIRRTAFSHSRWTAMPDTDNQNTNQSPPYQDVDLFGSDRPLQDAVRANSAGAGAEVLAVFGRRWGSAEMFELGRQANANPPKLHALDAKGFRRDIVEFHPAYHALMAESIAAGLHASSWGADGAPAPAPAQAARA